VFGAPVVVDLVWGMSSSRAKHSEVAGDRSIILATQWERRVLQAGLVLGSRAAHAAVCSPWPGSWLATLRAPRLGSWALARPCRALKATSEELGWSSAQIYLGWKQRQKTEFSDLSSLSCCSSLECHKSNIMPKQHQQEDAAPCDCE